LSSDASWATWRRAPPPSAHPRPLTPDFGIGAGWHRVFLLIAYASAFMKRCRTLAASGFAVSGSARPMPPAEAARVRAGCRQGQDLPALRNHVPALKDGRVTSTTNAAP